MIYRHYAYPPHPGPMDMADGSVRVIAGSPNSPIDQPPSLRSGRGRASANGTVGIGNAGTESRRVQADL
jgi:autotransporter translocation and assembly factor TamB